MATNIKVLNTVQLTATIPGSANVVYAPTGTRSALVTSVAFYNAGCGASDVWLGVKNASITGTPAVIHKAAGLAAGASIVMSDVISLSAAASESVVGFLTAAGTVNCVVYGIERD